MDRVLLLNEWIMIFGEQSFNRIMTILMDSMKKVLQDCTAEFGDDEPDKDLAVPGERKQTYFPAMSNPSLDWSSMAVLPEPQGERQSRSTGLTCQGLP